MIYINFNSGGLGNQIFQLNIYYLLSQEFPSKVRAFSHKKWGYDFEYKNGLESIFNLDIQYENIKVINKIYRFPINPFKGGSLLIRTVNFLARKRCDSFNNSVVKKLGYNPLIMPNSLNSFIDLKDKINPEYDWVLYGLWTHYNYIENNIAFIKNVLIMKPIITPKELSSVDWEESILIHVRGGNFISSENHNLCDSSYFINALSILKQIIKVIKTIVVVSDDHFYASNMLSFVEKNIKIVYVTGDFKTDFSVIGLAKYAIIPNSSFSLWSRLLSNANKLTIAPKYFYKSNNDYWYLKLPTSFILIDN
jgi:hypothetical protein